ncbi:MAG: DUF2007 domain-containing protein [Verrucomicrobia bacterium]|nr:DUF2007 domain-containing protein [Verrucomicrobiota bacterium]
MGWTTVFQAFSPAEAQLLRSRLEAAGLTVRVLNELSAFSVGGYSPAVGGILVQVPEEEAAEAARLKESKNKKDEAKE